MLLVPNDAVTLIYNKWMYEIRWKILYGSYGIDDRVTAAEIEDDRGK